MAGRPKEENKEEREFSLRKAIPYILREISRERKTGVRKGGSSFEICIYARAERVKDGDTDFQNIDTDNLTESKVLKLGETSGGTIIIPKENDKNSNLEEILFFGLTKLNVVGEGTTNLTLNISFDAARMVPKIKEEPTEEADYGKDEYAANHSDTDGNNNERKINPLFKMEIKEEPMDEDKGDDDNIPPRNEPDVENKHKSEYVPVKRKSIEQLNQALEVVRKLLVDDDELMAALELDDDTTDDEGC